MKPQINTDGHREGESGFKGKPLEFSYDYDTDIITIEGNQFTGQLFRMWKNPDPAKYYRFSKDKRGLVIREYDPEQWELVEKVKKHD